jgi:N-acetylglucosaminyldiphosphoundecaprenol N-acetyl-beta-D-mannosaminyltransferase
MAGGARREMGQQGRAVMSALRDYGPVHHLFGIPIHALTLEETIQRIAVAVEQRDRLHIGVVNAAKIVNMRRNAAFMQDVIGSDLILADGMPVVWASKLLGQPLPERIAGIDLMFRMLRHGDKLHYRVYFLGATEEVLKKTIERISLDYPRIQIVGSHHGYFTEAEEPTIVADITTAKPDILLVAMTSPKKEQFLARWGDELSVPICHGVGGSFDVVAGKVQRAPVLWQRLGLEWLYRVKQEPRRLWKRYLVTNTLFCAIVLREFVRHVAHGPAAVQN